MSVRIWTHQNYLRKLLFSPFSQQPVQLNFIPSCFQLKLLIELAVKIRYADQSFGTYSDMGHTDGHRDIRTDMGHTDGHGTFGQTWDIRTDMGHTDGHGTYGRTWDIQTDIFGQRDILYCAHSRSPSGQTRGYLDLPLHINLPQDMPRSHTKFHQNWW